MGGAPVRVYAVPAVPLKNVPALGTHVLHRFGDPFKGRIKSALGIVRADGTSGVAEFLDL